MKHILKTALLLALALCLLTTVLPVSARYVFEEGKIPEGWTNTIDDDEVIATDILAPVNPNATQEAKNLYAYLCTLTDSQEFVAGTFDISASDAVYDQVKKEYGLECGLYSARYTVDLTEPEFKTDAEGKPTLELATTTMDFTNVDRANELFKKHYDNGNILLVHSDSAPRDICAQMAIKNGKYVTPADCIVELDKCNPDRDMQAYTLWMIYQSHVMESLKKLEDSGVKAYLWRPWIEFNYNNFNGVTDEGRMAFTRVFQQTVQMMIDYGLQGFLVTYSPGCGGNTIQRYPGNDYVDVFSVTLYSSSQDLGLLFPSMFPNYNWYCRSGKPFGFSELSCRTADYKNVSKQPRASWYTLLHSIMDYWPNVSWCNCWSDGCYSLIDENGRGGGNDDGMLFMDSPFTLNLSEIIDYRSGVIPAPGITQLFKSTDISGSYFGLEQRTYSKTDLDKLGLDLTSVRSLRLNTNFCITFYSGDDGTGDYWGYGTSTTAIPAEDASQFRSCKVEYLTNVCVEKDIYSSVGEADAWKANDGAATCWTADAADGTAWLEMDLGKVYTVGRYVLKNAGYAGRLAMYNTRDFQLQYSNDAVNWITVDTVTGNVNNQVGRNLTPFAARYVRLLITGPNSCIFDQEKNTVMVAELEIYAVDAGKASKVTATDPGVINGGGTGGDVTVPADEDEDDRYDPDYVEVFENTDDTDDGDEAETPEDKDDDDSSKSTGSNKKKVQKVVTETDYTWVIIVCVAAGVVLAGGIVTFVLLRNRKKKKLNGGSEPQA